MKDSVLVTLADELYIEQAKQLFSSAWHNACWKGDYALIVTKVSKKDLQWFKDKGIYVFDAKQISSDTSTKIGTEENNWPNTVLSKFYLFSNFFTQWKNVVFLDADIIVTGSLNPISKVQGLHAVKDHFPSIGIRFKETCLLTDEHDIKLKKEIKKRIKHFDVAFNSGVLAFSTDIIQKETHEKIVSLCHKYGRIAYSDETILNMYFYKKWKQLPNAYNVCPRYWMRDYGLAESEIKGAVLHFIGSKNKDKPWNVTNPYYSTWRFYKNKSNTIDTTIINKTTFQFSKKQVRRYERFISIRKLIAVIPFCVRLLNIIQDKKSEFKTKILFHHIIDQYVGLIGLLTKCKIPRLYSFLKKK